MWQFIGQIVGVEAAAYGAAIMVCIIAGNLRTRR